MDTLLDAISPDSPQTVRDVIIKEVMIEKLNNLNNYKRAQAKPMVEAGEPSLLVVLDDLKPLQVKALMGSRGKTSPHLTVMDWR